MIHFRGIASQIIVFLLVTGAPAAVAVPKKPPLQQTVVPTMSVCQARRTIVTELQQASTGHNSMLQSPPSGVVINAVELAFHAEPNFDKKAFPPAIYKVNLKTLGEVTSYGKATRINGKDPLNEKSHSHDLVEAVRENLSNSSILAFLEWRKLNYYPDEETPQAFANALNSLRLYARAFDSSTGLSPPCFADKDEQARVWVEFQKRVAAWHSLPARPPLFDAVRKQQLLAEDAVNQKQFEAAAAAYTRNQDRYHVAGGTLTPPRSTATQGLRRRRLAHALLSGIDAQRTRCSNRPRSDAAVAGESRTADGLAIAAGDEPAKA